MSPDLSGCTMPCRTNACIGHSIWSMQTANNGILTHRHLFRLKIYGFSFSVGMRVLYFSKAIEKSKSHFSCVQSACMRECELIRCWVVVLSLIISIQHMSISEIGNFAWCTQLITLYITQWPHRRTRKSIGKTGRFECIFLFFSFFCHFVIFIVVFHSSQHSPNHLIQFASSDFQRTQNTILPRDNNNSNHTGTHTGEWINLISANQPITQHEFNTHGVFLSILFFEKFNVVFFRVLLLNYNMFFSLHVFISKLNKKKRKKNWKKYLNNNEMHEPRHPIKIIQYVESVCVCLAGCVCVRVFSVWRRFSSCNNTVRSLFGFYSAHGVFFSP